MGNFFKASILAAGLLCLGAMQSAKADMITPTTGSSSADTFTGVDIFAVTSTLHPFGVTPIICPGTGSACNQPQFGSTAPIFEVATVTFDTGGGYTITETTPSGNGSTVTVNQNVSPTTETGYCAAAGPSIFTTGASALSVNAGTECTAGGMNGFVYDGSGNGAPGYAVLTYLGNGVFSVTDNSFQIAFQLPTSTTPEPSSLLMLGSGLLGLMGLGFRRKALV
jgi:hypothetical protein